MNAKELAARLADSKHAKLHCGDSVTISREDYLAVLAALTASEEAATPREPIPWEILRHYVANAAPRESRTIAAVLCFVEERVVPFLASGKHTDLLAALDKARTPSK